MNEESKVDWVLPKGEQFVCVCMDVIGAHMGFEDIHLDGLLICKALPFELTNFWIEGLGKFLVEDITRASVKIVAHGNPSGPRTLKNKETDHLMARITHFRMGLALLGARAEDFISLRGGYVSDGSIWVHGAGPQQPALYQYTGVEHCLCDRNVMMTALEIANVLQRLYASPEKWRRLKRTLNTFYGACTEREPYERMHLFVRTLDGIVKTRQGKGAKDFEARMKTITGSAYSILLAEAYDLRSTTAHLAELPKALRRAKRANMLLLFLEVIAIETLRRILTSPTLLRAFETDASIDAFWSATPTWNPKVRVHTVQKARKQSWDRLFE